MGRLLILVSLYLLFDDGCSTPQQAHLSGVANLGILQLPAGVKPASKTNESTVFPFGVASGDPLPDAVMIWSMLDSAAASLDSVAVWEINKTASFSNPLQRGRITTNGQRGYSLKVDVRGLEPNTTYYYRFGQPGHWSPIGRTLTAPASSEDIRVKLAVVSCNALEWGYFNAFGNIARQEGLNAVVHLGDYIYEYATGDYGDTTLGRIHEPRHEVVSEADYHQRYAQYRSDPQLQAAHLAHPFICVWDDHEVANDSHLSGAENHDPDQEGDYLTRMTAAKRVYHNWMPIREQKQGAIYRSFSFGRQVDLHMLDERLAGRDHPATDFSTAALMDSCRSMLGQDQFEWLCLQLRSGKGRWQLLGNQVMFAELDLSNILPQYAVNLDAWDGYAYEQSRLEDSITRYGNPNTIFLTGDTHCSWFFELENNHEEVIAHEVGTPSVSSANYDEFIQSWDTMMVAQYRLYRDNDHLQYANLKDHGYLLLQLDQEQATVDFHFSQSVRYPTQREKAIKTFTINNESSNRINHRGL